MGVSVGFGSAFCIAGGNISGSCCAVSVPAPADSATNASALAGRSMAGTYLFLVDGRGRRRARALDRPNCAHGFAVVQLAVLHDVANAERILDVFERVLIEHDQVCDLA